MSRLISHRFRGFAPYENTIDGLVAALDFGVNILEFDIRVTRCGTPIIYHDEWALDGTGNARKICEVMADDLSSLGGTFAYMPTAEALFKAAAQHPHAAHLLIDIKDYGFETEINALVHLCGLENRSTYVSWVPNVLYRMAEIAPHIPLCLSHWCQNPSDKTHAVHDVFTAKDGHIPRLEGDYIHGERSGWFVDGVLSGPLAELIEASKGWVCVPQSMITKPIIEAYHAKNIRVSTFSYIDWDHIKDHKNRFNIDAYFIDNKDVFDTYSS